MHKSVALILFSLTLMQAEFCPGQVTKKGSYSIFKSRSSGQRNASTLLEAADRLKTSQPLEALNKVEEALGVSLAQGDVVSEGRSYQLLGEINEGLQEWKLALENYRRAVDLLKTDPDGYQRSVIGLGIACLQLGQFDTSLQYFREALSLTSDPAEQRERWLSISEVYYQMGNYDEALKSLDNITPTITTSASLTNRMENQKAKIFARQNNFGKAQGIYSNSITSRRENKDIAPADDKSLQQTKEEIVDVLHGQQRYDDEINLRNQSITYNRASNNLSEVTRDKVAIGKTLVAKGDNAAALREMEDAARTADSVDNPKDQANAYLSLAELYEKNDRRNLALKTYRKYSDAVARLEKLNDHRMIERADLINRQKEIEELSKDVSLGKGEETLAQATVTRQRLVIYGLILLMMVVGITSYFIYRSAQASKRANQLLALKSLRSQMNPHFIFNALNSVNQFIAAQDERTANKFLSEFSQLMRLVLDYSQRDFISLESEMEILGLYLKLEHYRFRDKFSYEIFIAPDLQTGNIAVPPMLIQPYIENAVWHGLRYKEEKGTLLLSFRQEAEMLVVEIRDDGIGRTQSAALKTENQKKHNSTGIRNIEERLAILNKVYKTRYRVTVDDGHPGTCVRIYLPMNHPLPLPL